MFCVPYANDNDGGTVAASAATTTSKYIRTNNREQQQQGLQTLDQEECNIFSIGSNDQWGFENEVVQRLPGCVTHTFDCTLPNNRPQRKPNSDSIRFYPYCIGDGGDDNDKNENDSTTTLHKKELASTKQFLPYHELWKHTNTTSPPKLLKIDVEGFEFGVLPAMLRASPQEIWPEQIMVEVHWGTRMVDVPSMLRSRQASEISLLFGQLFNFGDTSQSL